RAIRPCHTGWVATSAVAVATEVRVTLGTQVAKCPASATPASTLNHPSRPVIRARSSSRRRSPATGDTTAAARALRQNAIAKAGAAANAINGPEVETPRTATASTATSNGSLLGTADHGRTLPGSARVTGWGT